MNEDLDFTPGAIEAADELVAALDLFARYSGRSPVRGSLSSRDSWQRVVERVDTYRRIRRAMTLTWTCHVCGDERPDARISVRQSEVLTVNLRLPVQQNVRYCNDRESCIQGSFGVSFVDGTVIFHDERELHGQGQPHQA